ncbi:hypothetical protein GQ53DRAFT_860776 [Thozetella sp. PMI_491]|nr:hypothetical protein GQ53DRAFT_860776 [Thozetella sp. PMI_491]
MDSRQNQAGHVAATHPQDVAGEIKAPHPVPSEEDRLNQMTLNTATKPAAANESSGVVTKQPGATPNMKPENYVIRLENLDETPDYVDCPYCKSRQMTKIRHESSSQTTLAAAVLCLCCGVLPVFIPFVCNWCADTDHYCEGCNARVAHKPHEGNMEPVLPPVNPARPGEDPRYQQSQYADMSAQSRHKLEPGATGKA